MSTNVSHGRRGNTHGRDREPLCPVGNEHRHRAQCKDGCRAARANFDGLSADVDQKPDHPDASWVDWVDAKVRGKPSKLDASSKGAWDVVSHHERMFFAWCHVSHAGFLFHTDFADMFQCSRDAPIQCSQPAFAVNACVLHDLGGYALQGQARNQESSVQEGMMWKIQQRHGQRGQGRKCRGHARSRPSSCA